jgi:hypothetical protein
MQRELREESRRKSVNRYKRCGKKFVGACFRLGFV